MLKYGHLVERSCKKENRRCMRCCPFYGQADAESPDCHVPLAYPNQSHVQDKEKTHGP
jgi:hypothetical protein